VYPYIGGEKPTRYIYTEVNAGIRGENFKGRKRMDENQSVKSDDLLELTVSIVSAYVANNSVPTSSLPEVVASVHAALQRLGPPAAEPEQEPLTPPVSIKKSITPDYLISLEDGRRYKTLKRHLAGRGMTPQQYRHKWNLPSDYPMVAATYAAKRSELAKSVGLGRRSGAGETASKEHEEPGEEGRTREVL